MTPIFHPPIERRLDPGFTLIEMLVVLSILALLATIAASTLNRHPAAIDAAGDRARLGSAYSDARVQAASSGAPVHLDIATILGSAATFRPALTGSDGGLVVYPDGSSNGGTVLLAGNPVLDVDWLSGAVRDVRN